MKTANIPHETHILDFLVDEISKKKQNLIRRLSHTNIFQFESNGNDVILDF